MPEERYDGVRPRHAQCPKCGYVPGGAAIREGTLLCPECGGEVRFDFEPVRAGERAHGRRWAQSTARVLWAIGFVVVVGLVALVWKGGGPRAGVACLVSVACVTAALRWMRPRL